MVRARSDAIVHGSLEVKANVTVQGQLVQRSDQRTKGNIQPTGADEDAANLEHLRRVDTVSYDETQGPMAGQHVDHGFIAQNLQAEFPGAVQSIGPGIVDGAPVDDLIGVDHGALLAVGFSATKSVDRSERTLSHLFVACIFGDVPRSQSFALYRSPLDQVSSPRVPITSPPLCTRTSVCYLRGHYSPITG